MTGRAEICAPDAARLERELPAPVERVWDYLTDPELLPEWLAQGGMGLYPGGAVELRFAAGEVKERETAGAVIRGVVEECDAPLRLVFTWEDEGAAGASRVWWELEKSGAGTRLRVTHRELPEEFLALGAAGWHAHLEILEARVRGAPAEPFATVFERARGLYAAASNL